MCSGIPADRGHPGEGFGQRRLLFCAERTGHYGGGIFFDLGDIANPRYYRRNPRVREGEAQAQSPQVGPVAAGKGLQPLRPFDDRAAEVQARISDLVEALDRLAR